MNLTGLVLIQQDYVNHYHVNCMSNTWMAVQLAYLVTVSTRRRSNKKLVKSTHHVHHTEEKPDRVGSVMLIYSMISYNSCFHSPFLQLCGKTALSDLGLVISVSSAPII